MPNSKERIFYDKLYSFAPQFFEMQTELRDYYDSTLETSCDNRAIAKATVMLQMFDKMFRELHKHIIMPDENMEWNTFIDEWIKFLKNEHMKFSNMAKASNIQMRTHPYEPLSPRQVRIEAYKVYEGFADFLKTLKSPNGYDLSKKISQPKKGFFVSAEEEEKAYFEDLEAEAQHLKETGIDDPHMVEIDLDNCDPKDLDEFYGHIQDHTEDDWDGLLVDMEFEKPIDDVLKEIQKAQVKLDGGNWNPLDEEEKEPIKTLAEFLGEEEEKFENVFKTSRNYRRNKRFLLK